MLLPQTIENLARIGANIEICPENNLLPQTLESIVRICVANGGHVTISAQGLFPQTLENLARIGRNKLTIRL
ncbi:hypothetical protein F6H22_02670 [Vibrio cholerae]|uniref:hypothetical protein n=1 Tax=Vibrio cholerae TaxID=666 RepID=UPI00115A0C3D|nr:hypothetical protein [Vibrio cholerae]EGQ9204118.1 hypothetical protein [Vibrio cholerae]EGQ9331003.1 hypothetical protein [Vibrio cholerae]EJL6999945.1 hypothetical protein [Vibrio cholerae]EJL7021878.1 hypothetical protein [Vibrio cholerae]MCD6724636.1 hypothetical protein [Vibrio cholerae]